jgi:hypothetical protein
MDALHQRLVLLNFSKYEAGCVPGHLVLWELQTNNDESKSILFLLMDGGSYLGPKSCQHFGVDKSRRQAKAGNEYYRNPISPQ